MVTHSDDRNLASMVEILTEQGRTHVLAQAYIEGVSQGDKRILLFDGEPVGSLNRLPGAGDYRANMHVGASVAATDLNDREREICASLGPELKRHGMLFVGIDVIDGYLTEINVTSPTGLQEINEFNNVCLEAEIWNAIETRL